MDTIAGMGRDTFALGLTTMLILATVWLFGVTVGACKEAPRVDAIPSISVDPDAN